MNRIDRLEILAEQYTPSPRHALSDRFARDMDAHPEARVRFDRDVLRWVRERQPWVLLREEHNADGPVFVYALRDAQELLAWLLPWGRAVEVLGPDWLRAPSPRRRWPSRLVMRRLLPRRWRHQFRQRELRPTVRA